MRWAYGVTTVPSRINTTLPRTLKSLYEGGFGCPRLFVDGCSSPQMYSKFGLPISAHLDQLKTVGNWILALWELWVREPDADMYAIFQDDFVCVKNLRQYLEQAPLPSVGYRNLYTFPANQKLRLDGRIGWFVANQCGLGAVATVYDRSVVHTLLSSESFVNKPVNKSNGVFSRTATIDGAIVNALSHAKGVLEYCHNPSLVQHIGLESSMGNAKHELAESFPGENFDALSLLESAKMNEHNTLVKMIPPGRRRPGKWRDGVIQIWVTRACDKACYGCTQGSNLGGNPGMITPEQFEEAVLSLDGYFGVVGVFGGNPAMHPKFDVLCEILRKHVPFEQRGLWCNNPMGKGAVMRETFNPMHSNLNVHLDKDAYDEFKRDWPESRPVGRDVDSRHSPVFVAMRDVIEDEAERWDLISGCDINKHWSSMIGVFRGELRAWFCEIAGAQSMLHQREPDYPDTGTPVVKDWWRKPMQDFADQVRFHCHGCGVPLRGWGELAQAADDSGVEQVSKTHENVYKLKRASRQLQVVDHRDQLKEQSLLTMIDYIGNARR